MVKVAVIIANGTEEIEGLTPVDVIRRCEGAICDIVSVSGEVIKGSHGIEIKADKLASQTDFSCYDCIVIPGGMPGAVNIANDSFVVSALAKAIEGEKVVASICASPAVVLADKGLIKGKKVTCYPAEVFLDKLKECYYTGADVQVDGKLITANGPKSALSFSLEICNALGLTPKF